MHVLRSVMELDQWYSAVRQTLIVTCCSEVDPTVELLDARTSEDEE